MIMRLESAAKDVGCKDEKIFIKYGFKLKQITNRNGQTYFNVIGDSKIDIRSFEDVLKLIEDFDYEVIVNKSYIKIYNYYIE